MYREFSGESPSAARSFLIALFRLCSKSTNVSEDHSLCRISSRVITCPGFSSRMDRMQKGWPGNLTRTPCLRNSRAARFIWKTPKRRTRLRDTSLVSATVHYSKDWATLFKVVIYVRNHNPIRGLAGHQEIMPRALSSHHYSHTLREILSFSSFENRES